jgi:hypothetical protein
MHTHSMIFVTIDKLVSPSSSVNGDPLDDFPEHWQPHFFFEFPLRRICGGGGLGSPPPNEKTCLRQAATAAAILWKVEFATS